MFKRTNFIVLLIFIYIVTLSIKLIGKDSNLCKKECSPDNARVPPKEGKLIKRFNTLHKDRTDLSENRDVAFI